MPVFKYAIYCCFLLIVFSCNADDGGTDLPEIEESEESPGIRVENGKLLDKNGQEFIPFGVNSIHIWLDEQNSLNALENEIPKSGANTVRLVTAGKSWTWNNQSRTTGQKRALVQKAINAGLVPMIEMHDGTCVTNCDQAPADGKMGLKQLVDEWLEPQNRSLLIEFEKELMLNIANEWGAADETFLSCYKEAISRLRAANVNNVIVIDAGGNCGQNPNSLLDYGNEIFHHDPLKNVVFSIHMYGFWRTNDKEFTNWTPPFSVEELVPRLAMLDAPVVLGEFGWSGEGSAINYNPEILLETCKANGIGWLFWAWSDGPDKPFYGVVDTPDYRYETDGDLSEAGQALVHDASFGFKAISKTPAGF
ncbi:cellulase family glycosylhydrolase [Pararhodonellum marinum]|uniref:cellulase family glycosylhydrolase n=1 Tax=Pararhodonellum marinum TaxID=2755358 RepID=UPI00188F3EA8|nr:cellulase family glycosylhydrolase [Pararhodonellum marinum]